MSGFEEDKVASNVGASRECGLVHAIHARHRHIIVIAMSMDGPVAMGVAHACAALGSPALQTSLALSRTHRTYPSAGAQGRAAIDSSAW